STKGLGQEILMPEILADRFNVATLHVNRLAQTGAEGSIAIEASGWDRSADQWNRIFTQLEDIRTLEHDWDGLGAQAPFGPLIESSVELARILRALGHGPPSSVAAGPDGTILFNWQDERGYLDAEVTKPYVVEWMQVVPGQPAKHWLIPSLSPAPVLWTSCFPSVPW